jgi:hypothetical protein
VKLRSLLLALGVLGAGCVTPVTFDQAKQRVLLRAAFEFACPPDKLSVQELSSDQSGPIYVGVSGCSRRAVYVRLDTAGGAMFINDTVPPTSDAPSGAAPVP